VFVAPRQAFLECLKPRALKGILLTMFSGRALGTAMGKISGLEEVVVVGHRVWRSKGLVARIALKHVHSCMAADTEIIRGNHLTTVDISGTRSVEATTDGYGIKGLRVRLRFRPIPSKVRNTQDDTVEVIRATNIVIRGPIRTSGD
jgi:hypothetical protein